MHLNRTKPLLTFNLNFIQNILIPSLVSLSPDCDVFNRLHYFTKITWTLRLIADCLIVRSSSLVLPSKSRPKQDTIRNCIWRSLWKRTVPVSLLLHIQPRNFGGSSLWIGTQRLSHLSSPFSMLLASGILPIFFHLSVLIVFVLCFYLCFPQNILSSALGPLCHPTTILSVIFSCVSFHLSYPLPVTAHILDIRNNSLDFSAHNLTVNRKWLTWISKLLSEHRARAAFVYTIILLKAFMLTNCLRSKKENGEGNPIKWNVREGGEKMLHRHVFV